MNSVLFYALNYWIFVGYGQVNSTTFFRFFAPGMYDTSYLNMQHLGAGHFVSFWLEFSRDSNNHLPQKLGIAYVGSLCQMLYWAQLTKDITKYKHPPFFSSQFLEKFLRYSYQICLLALRRISFFLKKYCIFLFSHMVRNAQSITLFHIMLTYLTSQYLFLTLLSLKAPHKLHFGSFIVVLTVSFRG